MILVKQVLTTQELESLSILTSGIAHDFNNLQGGILADSELLLTDVASRSPGRHGIRENQGSRDLRRDRTRVVGLCGTENMPSRAEYDNGRTSTRRSGRRIQPLQIAIHVYLLLHAAVATDYSLLRGES